MPRRSYIARSMRAAAGNSEARLANVAASAGRRSSISRNWLFARNAVQTENPSPRSRSSSPHSASNLFPSSCSACAARNHSLGVILALCVGNAAPESAALLVLNGFSIALADELRRQPIPIGQERRYVKAEQQDDAEMREHRQ